MLIKWNDVIKLANEGNKTPDKRVSKTEAQWREILTQEEFYVTRQSGTERAFSSDSCTLFVPGEYSCRCCATLLFDANEKFDSGTGWPSFTQPVADNVISYYNDGSHGRQRIEVKCSVCDAHLGHVFPDGPQPTGLRYCINAVAIQRKEDTSNNQIATFGGGCFWCTEALFIDLKGVVSVKSGYSSGDVKNPTYQQVCQGETGHAEVIQIEFDPTVISFEELMIIHMTTHNPTTLNQQGADRGTQYRSIVLTHSDEQKALAQKIIEELAPYFDDPIVTEVKDFDVFYEAEDYHQNYYKDNEDKPYCVSVIHPKIQKLKEKYKDKLK